MKLTKEKYNLLEFWTRWYSSHSTPETVGVICFSCGIAGVVVMELPDNHNIFNISLLDGATELSEIVNDYAGEIKENLI